MQETQVRSLVWEDPLEKEMATHSSILAWEIPWMEKPGWLQSMGSSKSWTHLSNSLATTAPFSQSSFSVSPLFLALVAGMLTMKVKVAQLCLTLCDPMRGILQARILEWVAISFSRGSSQTRDRT